MNDVKITHVAITERGPELGVSRKVTRWASWLEDRDRGDEDDGGDIERRWQATRLVCGVNFRIGSPQVLYPAVRLPSPPDHDPGDEEPRLIARWMIAEDTRVRH